MKCSRNSRNLYGVCKRVFAWILCISMMIDCLPASVMAEEVYQEEAYADSGSDQYSDDSFDANTADGSGQEEGQFSGDGSADEAYSGDGSADEAYSGDSSEDYVPDDSWPEEDIVTTDDGLDEEEIEALFQDEGGSVIEYMPDSDMTYTALWEEDKEPAQIEVLPVAKELVYTGAPQALIEGGTAVGGTLMYALGEGDAAAPEFGFSEELPAGTQAGYYYVWYYVQGDEAHADSGPVCMDYPVYIAKKDAVVTAFDQVVEQGAEADTSVTSVSLSGAAPGHELYDVTVTTGSTAECGVVSISPGGALIADEYGMDATDNYEISYADGTLTVKGQIVCILQNGDGTWPESAGQAGGLVVEQVDPDLFAEDHYSLRGYSTEYHADGSCTSYTPGDAIESLTVEGDVYL